MITDPAAKRRLVIGPGGTPITLGSLPPRPVRRWVALREAELVAAVDGELLTAEEACAMYQIDKAELKDWQTALGFLGVTGLYCKNFDRLKRMKKLHSI